MKVIYGVAFAMVVSSLGAIHTAHATDVAGLTDASDLGDVGGPGPGPHPGPGPGPGPGPHPGPGPGPGPRPEPPQPPRPIGPQPGPGPFPHPVGPQPGPGPFPHPEPPRPIGPPPGPRPGPGPFPRPEPRPPIPIHYGVPQWPVWDHPIFPRPVYDWNWNTVVAVTCTAQDSYGYQYPVTESDYAGYEYQAEVSEIEDQALDRCYSESNGDGSCFLVGCTPDYEAVP